MLQGQPARQNTFIMLQLLSLRICRTLCYLEWIMARLWVLVQVTSFFHGCCCWGSSAVRWCRVWTSALSMAMVYLVSTNLVCRVLMASDFVLTRLASSSRKLKVMIGTSKGKLLSYLNKFKCQKVYQGDYFRNMLADIAEFYPLNPAHLKCKESYYQHIFCCSFHFD